MAVVDVYEHVHRVYWGNRKHLYGKTGEIKQQREDAVNIETLKKIYFLTDETLRSLDNYHKPSTYLHLDITTLNRSHREALNIDYMDTNVTEIAIQPSFARILAIVFSLKQRNGCAILGHPGVSTSISFGSFACPQLLFIF